MLNRTSLLALMLLNTLFFSCEKILLGEEIENTPENNFELLWNDFDQSYGLFYARGWNWDSIYQVYRPQVTAQTTDEELWEIFSQMIDYLDDRHTRILDSEKDINFRSGDDLLQAAKKEFDLQLIENKYVDELKMADDNEYFLYGKVSGKDIGYIYLERMLNFDADKINNVIDALKTHQAIIVDIRSNKGGSDIIAERIAGAFADGEHFVYTSQTRNGPAHNDFDAKFEHYTAKAGDKQYLKPVIVLTNKATISAAEEFLLHMDAFALVTIIGEASSGDFSDISTPQFLPNGWGYIFSPQMYLLPDGTSLDGVGVLPDIFIKNTKEDITAGNDLVMERTLVYLKEEYNIK